MLSFPIYFIFARYVRVVVVFRGTETEAQGVSPWAKKSRAERILEMQYYPEDFKKAMVVKMAAPGAQSATSLAKETGTDNNLGRTASLYMGFVQTTLSHQNL